MDRRATFAVLPMWPQLTVWTCSKCEEYQAEQTKREEERAQRELARQQLEAELQQQREREREQNEAKLRQQQEEMAKEAERRHLNRTEIYCARVVDHYFSSGSRQRETFYIAQVFRNGREARAVLQTKEARIVATIEGILTAEVIRHLYECAEREEQRVESEGTIVDNSAPWRKQATGEGSWQNDRISRPFRLRWNRDRRSWEQ